MSLPNVTITSPSGVTTNVDFTAPARYRSRVNATPSHSHPRSQSHQTSPYHHPRFPPTPYPRSHLRHPPRLTAPKTRLQRRKPASLRLDLSSNLIYHPLRSNPVPIPLRHVDLTLFHGGCSCPYSSGFCHVCFLTAQEMATELASLRRDVEGRGNERCKCARGLKGPFCRACHADLARWMGRLQSKSGEWKKEGQGRLGFYWRDAKWRRAEDTALHAWEAHGEVLRWRAGAEGKGKGKAEGAVVDEEELRRLVGACEEWFRLGDPAHRPAQGRGVSGTGNTEGRDAEQEEANSVEQNGTRPIGSSEGDEDKARAERGSGRTETNTGTQPGKKRPIWVRAKAKAKGKAAKIVGKARKRCSKHGPA
ncbi:hypothetical protein NKR19_g6837 [Coniochaeta hoffmannii]|uniref:Uncharacterized protein n=1 Tax=Coniochaeta hoffmannii TaxID=91930 RepID=A0AA38RCQ5_9PEZI|nr:hypothetical protein NKR19_g6837 [Coniochaeta hoffmannii]